MCGVPLKIRHSIYIRTVSSYGLLSALLSRFKLVYEPFGQSIMYRTLISDRPSQEGMECNVTSVQEACAKCFAIHLLKFEIFQTA